jgi:hypothetical protein
VSPRGGTSYEARNEPNPMIGCRVQQTCEGRAEEAAEAGRNGKGGTSTRLASSGRWMGDHPGVDARFLSRWRGVFGKPQERSSSLTCSDGWHLRMRIGRRRSGESSVRWRMEASCLRVSEGEMKVRRAACPCGIRFPGCTSTIPWFTMNPGSLGRAGKANDPRPVSRWRDRAAALRQWRRRQRPCRPRQLRRGSRGHREVSPGTQRIAQDSEGDSRPELDATHRLKDRSTTSDDL